MLPPAHGYTLICEFVVLGTCYFANLFLEDRWVLGALDMLEFCMCDFIKILEMITYVDHLPNAMQKTNCNCITVIIMYFRKLTIVQG